MFFQGHLSIGAHRYTLLLMYPEPRLSIEISLFIKPTVVACSITLRWHYQSGKIPPVVTIIWYHRWYRIDKKNSTSDTTGALNNLKCNFQLTCMKQVCGNKNVSNYKEFGNLGETQYQNIAPKFKNMIWLLPAVIKQKDGGLLIRFSGTMLLLQAI